MIVFFIGKQFEIWEKLYFLLVCCLNFIVNHETNNSTTVNVIYFLTISIASQPESSVISESQVTNEQKSASAFFTLLHEIHQMIRFMTVHRKVTTH
ncbi:MAG: hypothetical protein C0432_01010 [Candidatus Puniceispirillum sp.]|nr:hypothetical protein [Candidatus Pelagibacter sp.]MBA4282862.1 hypothetical protein [Candidatus Puniceispirillum sp.]